MNIKNNAQMSANEATHQYLITDAVKAILLTDKAATDMVAKFEINRLASINSGAAAGIDNSGFSQEKLDAKAEMSFQATCLAGAAQVKLDELGKNSLSRQIHSVDSYYLGAADSEAATEAQALHDLLLANLALLTPNYASAAELVTFQSAISSFTATQGSSDAVHKISPELTQAFINDLSASKKNGTDLKKLIKKYKKTNKTFYNSMVDVMKPRITVHHTDVDLLLIDKVTGNPVSGAIATFTESSKSGISMEDGTLHVEEIAHGVKMMTIKSDSHLDYMDSINIVSGRSNSFKIELTPKGKV